MRGNLLPSPFLKAQLTKASPGVVELTKLTREDYPERRRRVPLWLTFGRATESKFIKRQHSDGN